MKKTIALIIVIVIIVALTACNPAPSEEPLVKNISYAHTSMFSGNNECFYASLTMGIKEKVFQIDGQSANVEDYIRLTILPLTFNYFNRIYTYELKGSKGTIEGGFKKDIFGSGYAADIESLDNVGDIESLVIFLDEEEFTIELSNRMEGKLSYLDILKIAKVELAELIEEEENSEEGFTREIIIKFINDSKNAESPYYWYIAFASSDDNYWSMLIDSETGDIITKRTI